MNIIQDVKTFKKAIKVFFPKNKLEFNFHNTYIKLLISDYYDQEADITFTGLIELFNWVFVNYRIQIGRITNYSSGVVIYFKQVSK